MEMDAIIYSFDLLRQDGFLKATRPTFCTDVFHIQMHLYVEFQPFLSKTTQVNHGGAQIAPIAISIHIFWRLRNDSKSLPRDSQGVKGFQKFTIGSAKFTLVLIRSLESFSAKASKTYQKKLGKLFSKSLESLSADSWKASQQNLGKLLCRFLSRNLESFSAEVAWEASQKKLLGKLLCRSLENLSTEA